MVKNAVLDRVFEYLQREQIVRIKLEAVSLESRFTPDGPTVSPVASA